MDVKEAVVKAKAYVSDLFLDDGVQELELEETEFRNGEWRIGVSFSRTPRTRFVPSSPDPFSTDVLAYAAAIGRRRLYKVVVLDNEGTVLAMKDRAWMERADWNWLLIDTNLLLLLIVGRAGLAIIGQHKRLQGYTVADYRAVESVVGRAAGLIVIPQVLAETSSLARHTRDPAKRAVRHGFAQMIMDAKEVWVPGTDVIGSDAFADQGLTDAILLQLCATSCPERLIYLLTADQSLAARARAFCFNVVVYG